MKIYIDKNESEGISNLPLNILMDLICFNFFGLYEYCMKAKSSKKEFKSKKNENGNEDNKIIYLYNLRNKSINYKKFFIFISFVIVIYILDFFLDTYRTIFLDDSKYAINEYFNIMDIVYLFFIFRIKHKMVFYKHQKLFLIIIVIMELIKYIFQLSYLNNIDFNFPEDLKYLTLLIISPFNDSMLYYIPKYYMEYTIIFNIS